MPGNRYGNADACPSCDRYVGPVGRCPYCGSDVTRPDPLRALRVAALVLAGVGLLFLYLMARHRDLPLTEIGTITPLMNGATVHVSGTVRLPPYISRRRGGIDYLSFLIDDATGALLVSARGHVAPDLVRNDAVPERGQSVDVTGRVTVRAGDRPCLYLQRAAGITAVKRTGLDHCNRAKE